MKKKQPPPLILSFAFLNPGHYTLPIWAEGSTVEIRQNVRQREPEERDVPPGDQATGADKGAHNEVRSLQGVDPD